MMHLGFDEVAFGPFVPGFQEHESVVEGSSFDRLHDVFDV